MSARKTSTGTATQTRSRETAITHLTSAGTRPPPDPSASVERPFDVSLLVVVAMLLGLGIVMVYSGSIGEAENRTAGATFYLSKHLKHVAVGIAAFALGMLLNYQVYRRLAYPLLGAAFILLILTLVVGVVRGNARRWIDVPFLGEFQPAEAVKLAFVVYLAYSLEKKVEEMKQASISFLPHFLVAAALMSPLIMQPDLGSAVVIAAVLLGLQVLAGTRWTTLFGAGLVALPMALAYMLLARGHRMEAFLNGPWESRLKEGYQPAQSLMSLGSGGWSGLGLGQGRQKMGFLTQSHTDFIFATIGEELGLIGTLAVLFAFAFLCWRGFRAALKAPDRFGRYLAFGITLLVGLQAFVNMGVATTLLPTKGLNLPFVSGGGSSLIVTCFTTGILLNISRYAEAPSTWKPYYVPKDLKKGIEDLANMVRSRPKKKKKFKPEGTGVVPWLGSRREG